MLDSLDKVLQEQIRDLYSAESQLLEALPRLAKAATTDSLRAAITGHLDETKEQLERLKQVAEILEIKPGGKKCKAMEGLIAEGKEAMEEEGDGSLVDLAIIAAAQRVEHYEIAAYGTARAMAQVLGKPKVVTLLQKTLDEEGAADKKLTGIAEDEIMPGVSSETGKAGVKGKSSAKR